jgi:hypothetical protein
MNLSSMSGSAPKRRVESISQASGGQEVSYVLTVDTTVVGEGLIERKWFARAAPVAKRLRFAQERSFINLQNH